jgi:hypothetical protein
MAESFDRDDWTGVRGSRLPELPAEFVATRNALHQVAFFAMSPARYQVTGRMGLRATPGGFGTPEYEGKVARVEGLSLVLEERDRSATQIITTVREAARFFGVDYRVDWFQKFRDPLEPMDPDETLQVDEESARVLAHWFGFGSAVLGELRAHAGPMKRSVRYSSGPSTSTRPSSWVPRISGAEPAMGRHPVTRIMPSRTSMCRPGGRSTVTIPTGTTPTSTGRVSPTPP